MAELDVVGLVAGAMPQGQDRASDLGMLSVCRVYAINTASRQVQVTFREELLWLPAQPGRYRRSTSPTVGLARVLVNPATGRPLLVLGPLDPMAALMLAPVAAVSGNTVTVTWEGTAVPLPAAPSTYSVGGRAWVDTDDWGTPYRVSSPTELPAPTPTPDPDPPPTPAPSTRQETVSIGPTWSGSWRASRGAWDRWNVDRYGGRSTLYQGNKFGSGQMIGLATYGDQIRNLGAISIDRIQVTLNGVGLSGAEGLPTVQGSPHGSKPAGAPSGSGATAAGWGLVDLPAATFEQWRTGALAGLVLIGAGYNAVAGAGNGAGMVLQVTFTRPV